MTHDVVDPQEFDCLLAALDPDRERAGQRYVLLRRKLVTFFDYRGILFADDCADQVLIVAGRRIAEGEQVRNVTNYCVGIARMVLCAQLREQARERSTLGQLALVASPAVPDASDWRMQLFDECLEALPAESRDLILDYYRDEGGARIEARKALAERLGIPLNALRIRAWRIRAQVEDAFRAAEARRRERQK